jgi:nucleotide-binding universal stress UspA family protein
MLGDRASIGTVAELPGADIATHLTRHGVNVTVERIPIGKIDVSNTILSYAADTYPDLIVMGGYGHSRLRELFLAGRHVVCLPR